MDSVSQMMPGGVERGEPARAETQPEYLDPCRIREGQICPHCGKAVLEYDGLLNLVCPACSFAEAGCFT